MINRRGLITGLVSFIAAPAIVRAASLMPVKSLERLSLDGSFSGFGPIQVYKNHTFRTWIEARMLIEPISTYYYMADGSVEIVKHK